MPLQHPKNTENKHYLLSRLLGIFGFAKSWQQYALHTSNSTYLLSKQGVLHFAHVLPCHPYLMTFAYNAHQRELLQQLIQGSLAIVRCSTEPGLHSKRNVEMSMHCASKPDGDRRLG
eukprot:1160427-Pelagomonas_calceolata.AAC.2